MYIRCFLPKTRRKVQPAGHYFDLHQNNNRGNKQQQKTGISSGLRGNLRFTLCVKLRFPLDLTKAHILHTTDLENLRHIEYG